MAEIKTKKQHEKGVALIMVLTTLTLVSLVVSEFAFESRVEYQVAINAQDELQAYNNALSAMRLRSLLLKQASKMESTIKMLFTAMGLPASSLPPTSQIMQMVPIDCGMLSGLFKLKDSRLIPQTALENAAAPAASGDEEAVNAVFMGDCSAELISEHSKISVNILRNNSGIAPQQTIPRHILSLYTKDMEKFFEKDDANGQHAEKPDELVSAIKDWVDDDSEETGGSADEDRHYQYLDDSYKAKNAPFDSLEEIQLVYGINDELWNILRDKLTIYTQEGTIDAATASLEQILFALGACLNPQVDPLQLQNNPGLALFLEQMQLARIPGLSFAVINSSFVTSLLTDAKIVEYFDTACIKSSFAEKSGNTWFRIIATGSSGNVTRRINAVFQAGEGKYYYWREE